MVAQGLNSPAPPQVLKALQGARWLSPDSDTYVGDLFDIVGEYEAFDDDDPHTLLRLAAGLLPSLIAPETNLLAWLCSPRCLPGFESILSPIRAFAAAGNPLRPEHINVDEGLQDLQGLIVDASVEARKWLEEAPHYQTKFPWAVRVWRYLCREGVLSQMLTPVSQDRRDELNDVRDLVNLLNRDRYAEVIHEAENLMGGRPAKQGVIVGNARDWLEKRIDESKDRAATWCSLVSREAATRSGRLDSWLQEQVSVLRSHLQTECPTVLEALLELGSEGNPQDLAASAGCAMRSIQQLADYLNIDIQHVISQQTHPIVRDLETMNKTAGSASNLSNIAGQLEAAISRRLLWVPSVELDDVGLLTPEDRLAKMSQATVSFDQGGVSLEQAIRSRMNHRDFRFFDLLMSAIPEATLDLMKSEYSEELAVESKTLKKAIESTQTTVDQAEKDGVIEFEGSQWNKHQHTLDDVDVEAVLNFSPVYHALEAIKNELHEERMQRGQELLEEWQTLLSVGDIDDLNGNFLKEVSPTFEKASNSGSLD